MKGDIHPVTPQLFFFENWKLNNTAIFIITSFSSLGIIRK